ncbi:MAG TPA: glycosyltransferase, partial [Tepiditoga sp.]|nr:glycosyltransferase [Tepiditoga sp.]
MKLNKVIAPTDNIRDELIEFGVPTEHVVTIPTGIDTDRFEEETVYDIRKEYNITDEHKILLFVGRLAKEKNIDFLIEVFDEYVKKDKNARFVIVGDGNEREHLEKIVEDKNLKNEVIFTGALPREKVIDVYKEADLFIFASY